MRKLFFVLLVVTLGSVLLLSACAEPTPTATPTAPPATTTPPATTAPPATTTPPATTAPPATTTPPVTTAPPATTEVTELRLATILPPMSAQVKLLEEWAQKITEATSGEIEITIYPGSTLMGDQDVIAGVKGGLADLGEAPLAIYEDQFPLTGILQMPFLPLGDSESIYKIWTELEEKFPEMKAEFKDFHPMFGKIQMGTALHTSKNAVRVPEDAKGLKLQASGIMAQAMHDIGASPVSLDLPDWYTSLDRGLIEGICVQWDALVSLELYTVLPYHTDFPSSNMQPAIGKMVMNLDSWNKLSPDVQKVFDDLDPWMAERMWQTMNEINVVAIDKLKAEGHTFVTLTTDEEKLWYDATSATREAALDKIEARGLPARAIYEELLRLAEQ